MFGEEDVIFAKSFSPRDWLDKIKLKEYFRDSEKVMIKLHMGVPGNPNHINVYFVKEIVNYLKSFGIEPFLFDTITLYPSRATKEKSYKASEACGFTKASVGCEIIIGDGGKVVKSEGALKEIEFAKEVFESDGILVISHVKGHGDAGFGGAIKNIGMGLVSRKTKRKIHEGGAPLLVGECKLCKTCEEICPMSAIKVDDKGWYLAEDYCFGCGLCVRNCPYGALRPKVNFLTKLLTEVTVALLKNFEGKLFFINVLKNISKYCDCCDNPGPILCKDVGVLFSRDPIKIDKVSLDLINKVSGKNLFKEVHGIDPYEQIEAAEEFGFSSTYRLVRLGV